MVGREGALVCFVSGCRTFEVVGGPSGGVRVSLLLRARVFSLLFLLPFSNVRGALFGDLLRCARAAHL